MGNKKYDPYDLGAYEDQVNISLFNEIIAFVIHTAGKDANAGVIRDIKSHMWFHSENPLDIQNKYGIRYFGELLERYEERIGSDIASIRAIALGMAFVRDLLKEEMFVGNQKVNFIRQIERLAVDDIYMKGTLFLLYKRDERGDNLRAELISIEYRETQELIFVLTIFDDFEMVLEALKPQLITLLSTSRSISAINNAGLFAWLIKNIAPVLQANRKKDMALFRALSKLPVSFVKEESPVYAALRENGYSHDEIVYLNYSLLLYPAVGGNIYLHSITAEKIAISFAKTFINSPDIHSEHTYEYLSWLLDFYETFEIKLQGHEGLISAIKNDIKLENPKTFAWLFSKIKKRRGVFKLNIMEAKWDSLSQMLIPEAYMRLFDEQIENQSKRSKEYILKCITKYDSLTCTSYLDSFAEYGYPRNSAFAVLVNKGIINLKDSFIRCVNYNESNEALKEETTGLLKYIYQYIEGIHSKEAFEFFQYLFENYSHTDLLSFWGEEYDFSDGMFTYIQNHLLSPHKQVLTLKRKFLSDTEHRQLLNWLDDFIFAKKPDQYMKFVVSVLGDHFIAKIVPKVELREIYDYICKTDCGVFENYQHQLKEKYLTIEELAKEAEAELASIEDEKRKENLRQQEEMDGEMNTKFDNSFSSLFSFQKKYQYCFYSEKHIMALQKVKEKIDGLLCAGSRALPSAEIRAFIHMGNIMYENGIITFDELKKYILTIEEELPKCGQC